MAEIRNTDRLLYKIAELRQTIETLRSEQAVHGGSMQVPTVRVKRGSGFITINTSDATPEDVVVPVPEAPRAAETKADAPEVAKPKKVAPPPLPADVARKTGDVIIPDFSKR